MELLLLLVVIGAVVLVSQAVSRRNRERALEQRRAADLDAVRKVTDEDVTAATEFLQKAGLNRMRGTR